MLPVWMAGAFVILFLGGSVSALLKGQSFDLGRVLVLSLGFAFVWGAASAPMTAYFCRKEAGQVSARDLRGTFLFCLTWATVLGTVGFLLFSCSGGANSCLTLSGASTAIAIAATVGGFLSLMMFSS